MPGNNPNLNMNEYIKFGEILSICSKIWHGNEILTLIKGHNFCYEFAKNDR